MTRLETLAGLDNDIAKLKYLWSQTLVDYAQPDDRPFKYWLRYHSVWQCGAAFEYVQIMNELFLRKNPGSRDFVNHETCYQVTDYLMELDGKAQDELEKRIAELNAQHLQRIEELREQHRLLSKRWKWPIHADMKAARKKRVNAKTGLEYSSVTALLKTQQELIVPRPETSESVARPIRRRRFAEAV